MDLETALETLKEVSKAATKFNEVVLKFFRPGTTKRQADADIYAAERKAESIRNHPDMVIEYTEDGQLVRAKTTEELSRRAVFRESRDAIRQQENMERVIEIASYEIEQVAESSDEPVDDDWIVRFFDIAKDISNEDMQRIWAKILASEVTTPRSFSLRTLETLRNISSTEAKMFQKIVPLVLHHGGTYFLLSANEVLNKYGTSFSDVLCLDECGLVNSSGTVSLNFQVTQNKAEFILSDKSTIAIMGYEDDEVKVSVGIHTLTKAGKELYAILSRSMNEEYMIDVAQHIFEMNRMQARTSVHELVSLTRTVAGEEFTFRRTPSVSFGEADAAQ